MSILNYTTSISSEKTASQIQKKLAESKARAILSEYDDAGIMVSISFQVSSPHGLIFFKLPANIDGVLSMLIKDYTVPTRLKSREQASRVAWRILKSWVDAQLAIVDAQMATVVQVFLPYALTRDGKTIYETMGQSEFKQLTHSGGSNV